MGEKIRNYRELNIWKCSMEVVDEVYDMTKPFPKEEVK